MRVTTHSNSYSTVLTISASEISQQVQSQFFFLPQPVESTYGQVVLCHLTNQPFYNFSPQKFNLDEQEEIRSDLLGHLCTKFRGWKPPVCELYGYHPTHSTAVTYTNILRDNTDFDRTDSTSTEKEKIELELRKFLSPESDRATESIRIASGSDHQASPFWAKIYFLFLFGFLKVFSE